jgi:hypothetical protein
MGNTMKLLMTCLWLALGTAGAFGQTLGLQGIEIIEPGIYDAALSTRTDAPDSAIGTRSYIDALHKATSVTTTIHPRPGLHFGFRFLIVGEPLGRQVTLDLVTNFPAPGLHQPGSAQAVQRDGYVQTARLGSESFIGYTFDEAWEMVPGVWKFEIWDQSSNRKLAEQSFTVTSP